MRILRLFSLLIGVFMLCSLRAGPSGAKVSHDIPKFSVPPPPFSEGIFPCSDCHADMETNPERRELEGLLLSALRALIDEEAADGNHDAVIAYGRRYLSIDELAEDVHGLLLSLYEDTGRRTEALRQFEWLAQVLDEDVGAFNRKLQEAGIFAVVVPAGMP